MNEDKAFDFMMCLVVIMLLGSFISLPIIFYYNSEYEDNWYKELKDNIGVEKIKCTIIETAHEKRRVSSGLYASRVEDIYLVKAQSKTGKIYVDTVSVFELNHNLVGRNCIVKYKVWRDGRHLVVSMELEDES